MTDTNIDEAAERKAFAKSECGDYGLIALRAWLARARIAAQREAELRRDAERWAFLREHGHEYIDGITLHQWIGQNRLRCGGWDKTIDAAIAKEGK